MLIFVFQWDLVCDRAWLVELSMSMQAAGKMIGALVFNHLSDKYGRKMVFLSCFWANVVVASTRAFSPNMVMYSLLVFLGGTVQQVSVDVNHQGHVCLSDGQMFGDIPDKMAFKWLYLVAVLGSQWRIQDLRLGGGPLF